MNSKRSMVKLSAHLFKFILIACMGGSVILKAQIKARIVGVKDGDTVVALLENRQQITLRLAEVDCPEKGQPFRKNAKQFTSELLFGKQIVFYPTATDRYKRTVARIYLGGTNVSAEIIKKGTAGGSGNIPITVISPSWKHSLKKINGACGWMHMQWLHGTTGRTNVKNIKSLAEVRGTCNILLPGSESVVWICVLPDPVEIEEFDSMGLYNNY